METHKKVAAGSLIFICTILVIYFAMAAYFANHFYLGSEINGINVSGKNVEKAKELMEADLQAYSLNLKGREDKNEQISAKDVGLKYDSDEQFKQLKESQKPFKWVAAVFNKETLKMTAEVIYDEELLKQRIDKLSYFTSSNIIEPKNPSFKFTDSGYVTVPEVKGNKVDKAILYERVTEAIKSEAEVLDLEAANCYVNSQYTSSSPRIVDTKNILNKYASTKITYVLGDKKEILDGATISKWLSVTVKLEVMLDEKEAKNYIDKLSDTFGTIGKTRNFVTSAGKNINIGGGDYGWSIDKEIETMELLEAIKAGKTIEREPAYTQTAFAQSSSDIGNTYVEIDLTNQHMWFYKNGSLVVEGDIVTGNVRAGNTTPPGVFKLKYKAKNAVLRGPGYAAPVSFWMPFNRGIGIHDASWRSKFGGTIYKIDGSHGCINSPYNLAKKIYENIEVGTPVICYN
jgi:lipoprotein-anchoring transpeptidase ErfK/SrfK